MKKMKTKFYCTSKRFEFIFHINNININDQFVHIVKLHHTTGKHNQRRIPSQMTGVP